MIASEDIYVVEYPDGGDALEEAPLVPTITLEEGQLPTDQNYSHLPDPPFETYALTYTISGMPRLPDDATREYLETIYNNGDELGEAHAALRFLDDLSFWTSGLMEDVPVHPAAAEFLQEHDAWNENLTIGD